MGLVSGSSRVLADTNAFYYWLDDDARLTPAARTAMTGSTSPTLLSVVSLFELTTKHRIGKLRLPAAQSERLGAFAVEQGFELMQLGSAAAARAGLMHGPHRDPFDRLIIAQALVDDLSVVTSDAIFEAYGVRRIW